MLLRLLLAALLPLLLIGCEKQPTIRPLTADAVVLAFGDSITHGNGATPDQSYPSQLSELLGVEVINAGIPGETTSGGLKRLSATLDQQLPQLVLLCEGGNDFLRRLPTADTTANLRAMIAAVRASGADLILVAVPRPGLFLKADPVYAKLADEFKILLVEETLADILAEPSLKSDAIHPNATGYRRLAEELARVIAAAESR